MGYFDGLGQEAGAARAKNGSNTSWASALCASWAKEAPDGPARGKLLLLGLPCGWSWAWADWRLKDRLGLAGWEKGGRRGISFYVLNNLRVIYSKNSRWIKRDLGRVQGILEANSERN
jgi:hypothetical protein